MKKIISFMLAAVMLVSAVPTAFAADYTQGTQVVFEAANNESYTITVPAKLNPGQSGTVTLDGSWPSNKTISVTADPTVTLTNSILASDQKVLDVTFLGISEAGNDTTAQTFTETVSVEGIENALFGTWSGKFNYNVDVKTEQPIAATFVKYLTSPDCHARNSHEDSCYIECDPVALTWEELKLAENGTKYGYDASKISDTEIKSNAFTGCLSLKSIIFPDTMIDIAMTTFAGCTSLKSVKFPANIEDVGTYQNCTSLTSITFKGTVEQWNTLKRYTIWNAEVPATYVQCSDGTVSLS